MLGLEVAESTAGRYMVPIRRPPSQGWKTFLRNHAVGIASLDLLVVRTISFKLLYGQVIRRHAPQQRRRVTALRTFVPAAPRRDFGFQLMARNFEGTTVLPPPRAQHPLHKVR